MDSDADDEAPPMLVAADGGANAVEASLTSELADVTLAKVPISIITGRTSSMPVAQPMAVSTGRFPLRHFR